jgi:23S rRNA (guanosine2251-2'-O)-methyltransferase
MLVYGKNTLLEVLKNKITVKTLFLREGVSTLKGVDLKNIDVRILDKNTFDQKFPEKNQGIVADIDYKIYNFDEAVTDLLNENIVAVLDHIQDPHNFGAIVRAGHCFGVKYFIIAKDNQCNVTPTVFKSSAGSLIYSKIVQVTNIARCLDSLKKLNFFVYAADIQGSVDINKIKDNNKKVVIIGSEDKGIRQNVLKRADLIFKIPMKSKIDSLNASQSASIIFYELVVKGPDK